jgi:hypothetical protein
MAKLPPKKMDTEDTSRKQEQCFVIMPISAQHGYDEGHFQLVYEDIIKPAIIAANLIPFRADETKNTNLIQLDILRNVIESPIAICDMSSKNPNVFYELGMRQAFDLPTVLLRDEITDAPFDVNGLRYVTYKKDMKHRDVVSAIEELTITLKDTFEKRDDKSEINSLIRLMELANPAVINKVELTDEVRIEKLNELHLEKIMSSIDSLSMNQSNMMRELNKTKSLYNNATTEHRTLEEEQKRHELKLQRHQMEQHLKDLDQQLMRKQQHLKYLEHEHEQARAQAQQHLGGGNRSKLGTASN